jgi:hypothetical protein
VATSFLNSSALEVASSIIRSSSAAYDRKQNNEREERKRTYGSSR